MRRAILALTLAAPLAAQVSYERILRAASEPANWLTYSGGYAGHRHSRLAQITPANVARLKPVWTYQANNLNKFETSPLAIDGVLYISEPPSNAAALDGRTGRPLWFYRRSIPPEVRACCGQVNRGLAVLDDSLFLGTLDAHLVALDLKTGRVRWDTTVADYKLGYSITVAPLAVKDKILIGVSGGELGVRGLIDAYDAKTGRRLWRFWTVPGPGEAGNETWAGDSWKTGAAATWITGSFDPETNLIFWGTGNPGPDYDGDVRQGDNLYSDSLVALDADTGTLRWHFQFTPHDVHDWDSNQVPVLFDKFVATANRNGFYYVLERATGKFLAGREFGKQTWSKGLDDRGRPVVIPNTEPTAKGVMIYPGMHGATNWFSPAYNPNTGTFFVAVREEPTVFFKGPSKYSPGAFFFGGSIRGVRGLEPSGSIKALKAASGELEWQFLMHSPPWGGLLSTAGGLVFGGSAEGYFFALDSPSGRPLWRYPTGGAIFANPVTYVVNGKQHVSIASGHSLFAFAVE